MPEIIILITRYIAEGIWQLFISLTELLVFRSTKWLYQISILISCGLDALTPGIRVSDVNSVYLLPFF